MCKGTEMLRRTSLCVAGAISLVASANAADLYGPAGGYKDAPDVPVTTWTGFYAGINGGYGWSQSSSTVYAEARYDPSSSGGHGHGHGGGPGSNPEVANSPTVNFDKTGGFGGGQVGYNFQWNRFVLGAETDIQGANIDGSGSAYASVTLPGFRHLTGSTISANTYRESGLDYFGTVRGRLGYTFDQVLVYATGGFAYGGVSGVASTTLGINLPISGQTSYPYTVNTGGNRTGYVVGGGLEYQIAPLWSLKIEYQYIDLGSGSGFVGYHLDNNQGVVVDRARGYYTIEQNFNTVRVGLNYKLQSVVAPLK